MYGDELIETISIDEAEIIDVGNQNYQTIRSPLDAPFDVGLGHWFSVHGESLFIVNYDKKGIKKIDLRSGKHLAKYQFEGEGPGEYRRISYYYSDGQSHFIVDTSLYKIIQYDLGWNHIKDVILEDLYSHPFNDFAFSSNNFYYMSATNEQFVVNKLNLTDQPDFVQAFHRRIIPIGQQPVQYNEVYMDSNGEELAVINPALPFIFIYDREYQIDRILQIKFPGLDLIESNVERSNLQSTGIENNESVLLNPPPIAVETDKRISMNYFIIDILYLNNRIAVYYANRHAELRFLTLLKKEKNNWAHEGSYRFYKDDNTLFTIFSMAYDEPWLYLAGMFEEDIIRVNLSDLVHR
ncbi:hypothetical protein DYD21_12145 [Rhodohalobacter sp. SW132]|nr:hypothetical protein DYD21_12145 [Rhodohalobacter sp. SW132]